MSSFQAIRDVKIEIRRQYELLNLVAQLYKNLSKSLMEYIDNSLDSAEEIFNGRKYTRNIEILIEIDRNKNRIAISDNCIGMNQESLLGLANKINDSPKQREGQKRPWVNGQFGLGAHAYRCFAKDLTVVSKKKDASQAAIYIDRNQENAQFGKFGLSDFEPSGTRVELGDIDKSELKILSAEQLQADIEIYFEMFLHRNVLIKITDGDKEVLCKPFNYDSLPGLSINETITSWYQGTTRVTQPDPKKAIEVNLKVCREAISRPPYFARKGRRINFIKDTQSFINKTQHRKGVWGNFLLTGYIEVKDNLEPVVTRDDFAGGRGLSAKRSGVYNEIAKLEDVIFEAISDINKENSINELKNLSEHLSDILSKLAREDSINLRQQEQEEGNKGKGRVNIREDEDSDLIFEVSRRHGQGQGTVNPDTEEIKASPDNTSNLSGNPVEPRKKGMGVEFSFVEPPDNTRCLFADGVIHVFFYHPDFQTRLASGEGDLRDIKISARLANYLSAVISSEYKEQFYLQKGREPDRHKVLQEQVEFIFRFEDMMKEYIGKPLSSIGMVEK